MIGHHHQERVRVHKWCNVPFLGLLQSATTVAEELIPLTQHLAGAELAQACGHTRVLLDVNREIEERFVTGRYLCQASASARAAIRQAQSVAPTVSAEVIWWEHAGKQRGMTHRFASQTPGFRCKRALEEPMHEGAALVKKLGVCNRGRSIVHQRRHSG